MEFCLCLLFSCTLAHAEQNRGYAGVAIDHVPDWNKSAFEKVAINHAFSPMLLAVGPEVVPKRQDIPVDSKTQLAVIYPNLSEPYHSIFAKIIEGIEEQVKAPTNQYPIDPNNIPTDLNTQLKRNGVKVVIALGRQGLKVASGLDHDIAVVVGGVLSIPEEESRNLSGISLTPDPVLLFTLLKKLLPAIKRVTVIYNPQHNEWLLNLARDAAKEQGLELVSHEANDLAAAAHLYETVFASMNNKQDAIWLPQDVTTVNEETILPLVLKESWGRAVPVFSSSFVHVKKGVLFALSPNNTGLGHDLASVALGILVGESRKRGVSPLRKVLTAVNLRTASHIGLNIDYQQQRSFDFVFPEP